MKAQVNKVTIQVIRDDLFSLPVAGIVVPTDVNLTVSATLSAQAGPTVLRECIQIGWCEVASAIVTTAGKLAADKIIHAVGPRWGEGSERGKLANVTLACLRLAEQNRLKSIAVPPISTAASPPMRGRNCRLALSGIITEPPGNKQQFSPVPVVDLLLAPS